MKPMNINMKNKKNNENNEKYTKNEYKHKILSLFKNKIAVILLIFFTTVIYLINPVFLNLYNINTILGYASLLLVLSLGQTFVILIGGIDLSVGAICSLSGVLFVLLLPIFGYWTYLIVILIGIFCGFLNGFTFTMLRIPSFIATLGTSGISLSISYIISGGVQIPVNYKYHTYLLNTSMGIKNIYFITLLIFILFLFIQEKTRIGRYIYAIGSAEKVSWLSGIPIKKYKILVFSFAGFSASLGGLILSSILYSGVPGGGNVYLLPSIATVVLGGTVLTGGIGGVSKTLIGSLIIAIIANGMEILGINVYAQQTVTGLIIIAAVSITLDRNKVLNIK
jgi:ribose/xylose/arabinose/galactoside ABC-type transport system permease subunit